MSKKNIVPVVLIGFLFASPFVMAAEVTQDAPSMEKAPGGASAVAPSGMMGAGMMKDGSTMMGNRGGMMRQMMMGGQQTGDGQGGGMMGQGGMMSQGMKGGHGKGMKGHGMKRKHQQVVNRLDLIDVRLAKIEAMLERLMLR